MKALGLFVLLLGVSGCASLGLGGKRSEPCVPVAVAPVSQWELVAAVPVPGCLRCVRAGYATPDGGGLLAVWVQGSYLGVVDPKPGDALVPAWVDPGVLDVSQDGDVHPRPAPEQTCRWSPVWASDRHEETQ